MDTSEHWEEKEAMIDTIAAALSYAEDQLEDLRSLITDELELAPVGA
tara:strand:- start:538 stop:678 length:141 start_codon:yes stop_codon:yes gene_type:complete